MSETEKELSDLHKTICCGNLEAEEFCDLWFKAAHGIDDIFDTREDGRPTMTSEAIMKVFATLMEMYNCTFYLKFQRLLHPTLFVIHNTYCDVLAFEKAPESEKRAIADVERCSGNRIYDVVAAICGGYDHMRKLSPVIRQRSWLLQHDPKAQQF